MQTFRLFILLLCTIPLFTSCSKNENFSADVEIINALQGSPAASLLSDSNVIFSNLLYDSILKQSVIPSGTNNISLRLSGATPLSFVTNIQANVQYTAFIYDTMPRAKFYMRPYNLPATPGTGRCAVRIINLMRGSSGLYLASDTNRTYLRDITYDTSFSTTPIFNEIDTFPDPAIHFDSATKVNRFGAFRSGKVYTIYLTGRLQDSVTGSYKPRATVQVHN